MAAMCVVRFLVAAWVLVSPLAAGAEPIEPAPVWPVSGVVVHRFTPPRCEKCRGPRGVEITTKAGSVVRASVDGEVTFAGTVSRRLFVVQRVAPGVLLTYGWLASAAGHVTEGALLARGEVIGTTGDTFYLGARERGRYIDPLALLGLGRPRLVGPGFIGRWRSSR